MYKKRFAAGFLALMTLALLSVSAAAHGCHGRRAVRTSECTVCAVEDCTLQGRHTHDGTTYCGYPHESGVCDGSCLALCTVEGCTLAGRHSHDGTAYCGADHACGFCDGSCLNSAPAAGTHHGCHGRHGHC